MPIEIICGGRNRDKLSKFKSDVLSKCLLFLSLQLLLSVSNSPSAIAQTTSAASLKASTQVVNRQGAIDPKTVNLSTGDLSFAVPLATLDGGEGLGVVLAAQYSSNTHKIASTFNLEAPTGELGLGWSLPDEMIIRNNKGTGTELDDEYILSKNGSMSRLQLLNTSNGIMTFTVRETYKPWLISYDLKAQSWTIIDEDGVQSVYGGLPTGRTFSEYSNNGSLRSSIEWGIKWGKWVGSSSAVTGQEQYALVWHLSSKKNKWGEATLYYYNQGPNFTDSNDNEINPEFDLRVGASTSTTPVRYTRECYLTGITNRYGMLQLIYRQKQSEEYEDPHTEHAEPDAYQEKFQTFYLHRVNMFNGANSTTSAILDYNFLGADRFLKRILKSVSYAQNSNGMDGLEAFPDRRFEYWGEKASDLVTGVSKDTNGNYQYNIYNQVTGALYGALSKDVAPLGAEAKYTYKLNNITNSRRELKIDPGANWSSPNIYHAPNYTLSTWNGSGTNQNQLKININEWDTKWASQDIVVTSIKLDTLQIRTQNNFFVVLYQDTNSKYHFNFYSRDPILKGRWNEYLNTDVSESLSNPTLEINDGSAGILGYEATSDNLNLYISTLQGAKWSTSKKIIKTKAGSNSKFNLAAKNNYFFSLVTSPTHDYYPHLSLWYVDGALNWSESKADLSQHLARKKEQSGIITTTTYSGIESLFLYPGSSFVGLQVNSSTSVVNTMPPSSYNYNNYATFIIDWDKDYTNFNLTNVCSPDANSTPSSTNNECEIELLSSGITTTSNFQSSLVGDLFVRTYVQRSLGSNYKQGKDAYLYNGSTWNVQSFAKNDSALNNYYGLYSLSTTVDGTATYQGFDPYTLQWSSANWTYGDGNPTLSQKVWSTVSNVVMAASIIESIITLPFGGAAIAALDYGFLAADTLASTISLAEGFGTSESGLSGYGKFFTASNAIYYHNSDGSWTDLGKLFKTIISDQSPATGVSLEITQKLNSQHAQAANNFITFNVDQSSRVITCPIPLCDNPKFYQTGVLLLKNGQTLGSTNFLDQKETMENAGPVNLVGTEIFVTYSVGEPQPNQSPQISNAKSITLYRVINDNYTGSLQDYAVARVEVNDGYNVTYQHYLYERTNASFVASGVTALYHQVVVVPSGISPTINYGSGYTEHYIMNGHNSMHYSCQNTAPNSPCNPIKKYYLLPKLALQSCSNTTDLTSCTELNGKSYTRLANGLPYWTRICGEKSTQYSCKQVLSVHNDYAVFPGATSGAYFIRNLKEKNTLDSATQTVNYAYDQLGRIIKIDKNNSGTDGREEVVGSTLTYGSDIYPDMKNLNILSPVVQSVETLKKYKSLVTFKSIKAQPVINSVTATTRDGKLEINISTNASSSNISRNNRITTTYSDLEYQLTYDGSVISVPQVALNAADNSGSYVSVLTVPLESGSHKIEINRKINISSLTCACVDTACRMADCNKRKPTISSVDQSISLTVTNTLEASQLNNTVTTWKNWGADSAPRWDFEKNYTALNNSTLNFPFTTLPGKDDKNWLLTSAVKERSSSNGSILESQNVTGVDEHIIYDTSYRSPIASFLNASSDESGYLGFETYESTTKFLTNGNLLSTVTGSDPETVHTGNQAISGIEASATVAVGYRNSLPRKTVVSAWVKPDPFGTCQIGFADSNRDWVDSTLVSIFNHNTSAQPVDGWQYIETIGSSADATTFPTVYCSNGAIDDFKFAPLDSQSAVDVYDPVFWQPTAHLDVNGATTSYTYDMNRNFSAQTDPLGNRIGFAYTYSRPLNTPQTIFSGQSPNSILVTYNNSSPADANINWNMFYTDGFGRVVQSKELVPTAKGTGYSTTGKMYDGWGNLVIQTKPAMTTDIYNSNYSPDFISTFDWTTGKMSGGIVTYFQTGAGNIYAQETNDWLYPYSRVVHENNPLSRPIKFAKPGSIHKYSPATAGSTTFTTDISYKFSDLDPFNDIFPSIYLPGKAYSEEKISKPFSSSNRKYNFTYSMLNGEHIAAQLGDGSINVRNSSLQISREKLNNAFTGNTIRIRKSPLAFADPSTANYSTTTKTNYRNELIEVNTPDEGKSNLRYDKYGHLRFVSTSQNVKDQVLKYLKYDDQSRVIETGYFPGSMTAIADEDLNNFSNFPSNQLTWRVKYYYDGLDKNIKNCKGRVVKIDSNNDADLAPEVTQVFAYDAIGQIINVSQTVVTDVSTVTEIGYEYNKFGKPTQVDYPGGFSLVYLYDNLGRMISVAQGGTNYSYSGNGNGNNNFATYVYGLDTKPLSALLGVNGQVNRTYTYSMADELLDINETSNYGASQFFNLSLSYKKNNTYQDGNVQSETVTYPQGYNLYNSNSIYNYDVFGQLISVNRSIPSAPAATTAFSQSFDYDLNGNIRSYYDGAHTLYANTNRLQTVKSGKIDYSLDGSVSATPTFSKIEYDPGTGKTMRISRASGSADAVSFMYNEGYERVYKSSNINNISKNLVYSYGVNQQPLSIRDLNANAAKHYVYGIDGLLAVYDNSSGSQYFFSKDQLGSVRMIWQSPTNVLAMINYLPYGIVDAASSSSSDTYSNFPFLYESQEYDSNLGIYNYQERLYDPTIGRFYQPDPVEELDNPYTFVGNNPINFVDPTGEVRFGLNKILASGAQKASSIEKLEYDAKEIQKLLGGGVGMLTIATAEVENAAGKAEFIVSKNGRGSFSEIELSKIRDQKLKLHHNYGFLEKSDIPTNQASVTIPFGRSKVVKLSGLPKMTFSVDMMGKLATKISTTGIDFVKDAFRQLIKVGRKGKERIGTVNIAKLKRKMAMKSTRSLTITAYPHAETNVMRYADLNSSSIARMTSDKPACLLCQGAMEKRNIPFGDATGKTTGNWTAP